MTAPSLEMIRRVLDIGYRQVWVRFEDYEGARLGFLQQKIDPTPRINLDLLKWEDIADEEA